MICKCALSNGVVVGLPHLKPRFLTDLSKEDVKTVLSFAKHLKIRRGSFIVREDELAERMYLLTSGKGLYSIVSKTGRKTPLGWLTSGQIFGSGSMMTHPWPWHYQASVEMLSDGCALMWDRPTIRKLTSRFHVLLDNAFSISVTEIVPRLVAAQLSLVSDDARGRLSQTLLSLSSGIGINTNDGVEILIQNEELAAGAHVTQYTASRTVKEWERKGIVVRRRGKIVIRHPELLMKVS